MKNIFQISLEEKYFLISQKFSKHPIHPLLDDLSVCTDELMQ